MALDFHVAKNKNEAPYKNASHSIEWEMHKSIFSHHELKIEVYPLLGKIKDYYKDTKYSTTELQHLAKEIEKIKPIYFSNSQVIEWLNSLLLICQEAQEKKLEVWVYCD